MQLGGGSGRDLLLFVMTDIKTTTDKFACIYADILLQSNPLSAGAVCEGDHQESFW